MNDHPKQSALIWLTRNGFILYSPTLTAVVNLTFPPDTVNYLEVVDENKFFQLIQSFIKQYQLPQFHVYVVVGPDALIEKTLPTEQLVANQELEKQILDNIPFENIYSTKLISANETRILGFNANYYQSLKNTFDQIGWSIESVSPYFTTGQTNFNETLALSLLKNPQPLTRENFIKTTIYGTDSPKENSQKNQPKKKSLPWLLIIFFGLTVMLVILIVIRMSQKPPTASNIQPTSSVKPTTSLLPLSTLSATLSPNKPTTQSGNLIIKPSLTPSQYPITITP